MTIIMIMMMRTMMTIMMWAGDPDRACRVACQDSNISYRFINDNFPVVMIIVMVVIMIANSKCV